MNSLEVTDQASAKVATQPRVALADIEAAIAAEYYTTGAKAIGDGSPAMPGMDKLTICILVMANGFMIIGKSAPASPDNFNADLGRRFAYEDAVRQLWPLMGFALCDRLYRSLLRSGPLEKGAGGTNALEAPAPDAEQKPKPTRSAGP